MGKILARAGSLFVFAVAMVSWRRPDQIVNPTLWFEEGTQLLTNYVHCGSCAWWLPVNGSNILSAKLIVLPAFKLSILHAGRLAAVGSTIFIALVVSLIGTTPTHLRARYVCALAALLIPTAAENYGVALYTFWWAGLLIALALLWDSTKDLQWLRWSLLVLGGLSSPIMFPLSVLFLLRAWFERTRTEVATAALAIVLGLVSGATMLSSKLDPIPRPTPSSVLEAIGKFVGLFVAPGVAWPTAVGIGMLLVLAWLLFAHWRRLDGYFFLLSACIALTIAAALARAPIELIEPFEMGPRYFFYPYIFGAWLLLWMAWVLWPSLLAFVPVVMTAASILGGFQVPNFRHPLLGLPRWSESVKACAAAQETEIKIAIAWAIYGMTAADCRGLIASSIVKR